MTNPAIYSYAGHGWVSWGWRYRTPSGEIVVRNGLPSYDAAAEDLRRWMRS